MDSVRRAARVAYRFVVALFVIGVLVAFFLAGAGVFRATSDFDPHKTMGSIVAIGAAVLLLLALLWWTDRVVLVGTTVLFVLAFIVQPELATFKHPWVGAFHPLNAVVIFALSSWLAHRVWTLELGARRQRSALET